MISTAFILVATIALNAVSSFAAPIRVTRRGVVANPEVESIGRRSPQPIAADTVVVPRAEPVVPAPALGRRFPRRVYYEHYAREEASKAADVVARDAGSPSPEVVQARAPAKESTGSPAAKRALVRKRAADRPTGSVKKRSVKKRSANKKRSTKAKRSVKKRSSKTKQPIAISKRSTDKPLVKKSAVPVVTVSKRHSRLSSRSSSPRARSIKNRSTPASVNIERRRHHGKRTSYTIINIHKEENHAAAESQQCGCPTATCKSKLPPAGLPPTGTNGTDTTVPPTVPGAPPTSTGLPVPPVGPNGPVTTDPTTSPLPPTKQAPGGTGAPPVVPPTTPDAKLPPAGMPVVPAGPATPSSSSSAAPITTATPLPTPKKGKFDPTGTGAGAGAPPAAPAPPVARRRVVSKRAKISTTPSRRMSRRNAKRAV